MKTLNEDESVIEELKSMDIRGLTPRCKIAIKELADNDDGAAIFLFLSLNARIRDLEDVIKQMPHNEIVH